MPNSAALHILPGANNPQVRADGHNPYHAAPIPTVGGKRKAEVLEEVTKNGKKKRTVTKKKKDPNAPKRPPSSYLMFQNEIRKELKTQHPEIKHSELLTMISKQWAEMTDEQKAVSEIALL